MADPSQHSTDPNETGGTLSAEARRPTVDLSAEAHSATVDLSAEAHSAKADRRSVAALLDTADGSLVDLVDSLLDKGVVLDGEIVLGLADVDLIYVRLSAVVAAADKVFQQRK